MMKKIYSSIFVLLSCFSMGQSNLVPNPSFEFTTSCPTSGNISNSTGWLSFTDSPDFFHPCALYPSSFNVPFTFAGYQLPYNGQAFAGLIVNSLPLTPNAREYMGIQLSQTLTIGQKYYASFRMVLADPPRNCWSDKMGMRFTTYNCSLPQWSTTLMNNFSHIKSTSFLSDTTNWTLVKGAFIADSNYKYVTLGNFYNDANTDTINCASAMYTYAFFDMVCVSTDSLIGYGISVTGLKENNYSSFSISVYPNPTSNKLYISSAIKELENSEIEIINSFGQISLMEKLKNEIDVSELSTGYYTLKITSKDGTRYYSKFTKQ